MLDKNLTVEVCLSPIFLPKHGLEGKIVVVVDIFRATSVMVTALAHGVSAIKTTAGIEDCLEYQKQGYLTAGERDGMQVAGFDFGNSPFSFQDERVRGKKLAMTTTNGTKTIAAADGADQIIIGAFLNISAVEQYLQAQQKSVIIACAAWKDMPNMEDTLFAGVLLDRMGARYSCDNDSCYLADALFRRCNDDRLAAVAKASHVKRLQKLGIEKDIAFCLQDDVYCVVPRMQNGELVL